MQGGMIGFGYWAKILCKNFVNSKESLIVFDISKKARNEAKKNGFQITDSLDQLLRLKKIKFLIIAAPPASHYSLVEKGLEFNKHILVEKPFGSYLEDKTFLFQEAKKKKKVLMIDYSFIYDPGFRKLKELMNNSKIKSYESLRFNNQLPVQDVNLPEDLAIHDLSMLAELIPSPPLYCFCHPLEMDSLNIPQTALISITGKGWRAFIYASRVFCEKKRIVLIKSSKKRIIFKELNGKKQICFWNSKHNAEMRLKGKTTLELMFKEFFDRIKGKSGKNDFIRYNKMISLSKALNQSMQNNGKRTAIQWEF